MAVVEVRLLSAGLYSCLMESVLLSLPVSQGPRRAARLLQQALGTISSPVAFVVDFYMSLFPLTSGRIFGSPVRPAYVLEQA